MPHDPARGPGSRARLAALALLVSACGGSSGAPPGPAAPVASAGADQDVPEGARVVLEGSSNLATSGGARYRWSQVAGTPVELDDPEAASTSFVAPEVVGDLEFELTVTEASLAASDTVDVRVEGIPPASGVQKVQLHLHGQSNHNGAANPASMQWHAAWAARTGAADVLWWSDHVAALDQHAPITADFTRAAIDPESLVVSGFETSPLDPQLSFTRLAPEGAGGTPRVDADADGLHVALQSDPGDEWESFEYVSRSAQEGAGGLQPVHDRRFNRPLGSAAVLDLEGELGPGDDDVRCELEAELAWHLEADPVLERVVFRFVSPADAAPPELVGADEVLVRVPVESGGPVPRLDLLGAAGLLPDGDDNTLSALRLRIAARHGREASATWKRLELSSLEPDEQHQFDVMQRCAERYEERYGAVEHLGAEQHHPAGLHMNAFLPADADVVASIANPTSAEESRAWVDWIHAHGGLVAWDHPFGTSSWTTLAPPEERSARVRAVADEMLADRAHGADLLEVGYLNRGGEDLHDHLDLWDILLSNGVFLRGIGTCDSHGGPWATWMGPGSFTTWVYSDTTDEPALLAALAAGRATFGNPFPWDGRFTLRVGDAYMGDVARVEADESVLTYELEPRDPSLHVFLVQGLVEEPVEPGRAVTYLAHRTEIGPGPITLDTTRSSFVRLEAYSVPGNLANRYGLVMLTNPILLLRE